MPFNPANAIQDQLVFGEFGDINPSITDSSTFTFMSPETMEDAFEHEMEGCFLYSRHWNPTNRYLATALAAMEDTPAGWVTASGMSAITSVVMQSCSSGDEIVSGRTVYGGTYALLNNLLPRFGIKTRFVDITDLTAVEKALTNKTRILYTESVTNPLLEVADIVTLANIAHKHDVLLVVDNTFTPMILSPARLGADVVVHSLTKFINGSSDTVAGAICGPSELVAQLADVNNGVAMLFGPVLDSLRAASILKNLHTLHIRMQQHSQNALALAEALSGWGFDVHYPGLSKHPQHQLMKKMMHPEYGFGGMLAVDFGSDEAARQLMKIMQEEQVGYLAVSLGYFKTLFSAPGHSTSSEIPSATQESMGLTKSLVRFSVGIDKDIDRTIERMHKSLSRVGILNT
ncbi:MAG: cystathionine beta-lyase [Deltaproteobacteria bacterium RIFOXYA12_FULL_58_15]|nr:MAG: cystathionine beta-lyase [Deltaproteobacteria bacterium RIFOXYA12_FULL_58_15]OGR08797.1 MAG: cystathionine beta-lyase [Deltaproteobacteria bacterium RIFOXYB12_FULL_58_9]